MLYNVPESNAENITDRIEADTKTVMEEIGKAEISNVLFDKIVRVGKAVRGKVRPLKLIFKFRSDAENLLKQRRKFTGSVKINADFTQLQRLEYKRLLDELSAKNNGLERGKEEWQIKYINGVPKIVKKNSKKPLMPRATDTHLNVYMHNAGGLR